MGLKSSIRKGSTLCNICSINLNIIWWKRSRLANLNHKPAVLYIKVPVLDLFFVAIMAEIWSIWPSFNGWQFNLLFRYKFIGFQHPHDIPKESGYDGFSIVEDIVLYVEPKKKMDIVLSGLFRHCFCNLEADLTGRVCWITLRTNLVLSFGCIKS